MVILWVPWNIQGTGIFLRTSHKFVEIVTCAVYGDIRPRLLLVSWECVLYFLPSLRRMSRVV